jgi:hypothetical protein
MVKGRCAAARHIAFVLNIQLGDAVSECFDQRERGNPGPLLWFCGGAEKQWTVGRAYNTLYHTAHTLVLSSMLSTCPVACFSPFLVSFRQLGVLLLPSLIPSVTVQQVTEAPEPAKSRTPSSYSQI